MTSSKTLLPRTTKQPGPPIGGSHVLCTKEQHMTLSHFSVVDTETDKVIGTWVKYEDALQFWSDALNCDDANWHIFPTDDCYLTADV